MNGKVLGILIGIAGVIASTAASACGQMAPVGPIKPGAKISLRGYGYGFEGGARRVSLVWSTGETAGTASVNAQGELAAEIIAPNVPGEFSLIVREGDDDPAPNIVTVPVTEVGT